MASNRTRESIYMVVRQLEVLLQSSNADEKMQRGKKRKAKMRLVVMMIYSTVRTPKESLKRENPHGPQARKLEYSQ